MTGGHIQLPAKLCSLVSFPGATGAVQKMIWSILAEISRSRPERGRWTVSKTVLAARSGRDLHAFGKVIADADARAIIFSSALPDLTGLRAFGSIEVARGEITFSLSNELLAAVELDNSGSVIINTDFWRGLRQRVAVTIGVWAHGELHHSRMVSVDRPVASWPFSRTSIFGDGVKGLPRGRMRRDVLKPAMDELQAPDRSDGPASICAIKFHLETDGAFDRILAYPRGHVYDVIPSAQASITVYGHDTTLAAVERGSREMRDIIAERTTRKRVTELEGQQRSERGRAAVELRDAKSELRTLRSRIAELEAEVAALKSGATGQAADPVVEPSPVIVSLTPVRVPPRRPMARPRPVEVEPVVEVAAPAPVPMVQTPEDVRAKLSGFDFDLADRLEREANAGFAESGLDRDES